MAIESDANPTKAQEGQVLVIERGAKESQAAYLARSGRAITSLIRVEKGIFAKQTMFNEGDLSPEVLDLISGVMVEASRTSDTEVEMAANTKVVDSIGKAVGTHEHSARPRDEEAYDKTERSRRMFDGTKQKRGETYWNTLFFPHNTEATRAFAKGILDDKTVLLFGGGKARLREEMEQNGIRPRAVLNIDPFVSEAEPGADTLVSASASDSKLQEILREHGTEKADEIWAEYSVPAYLENPEEIRQLFMNIDNLLSENGHARIWPAMVRGGTEEENRIRKATLVEVLNGLNSSGNYEISEFEGAGRLGFVLHKVKSRELTGVFVAPAN